MNFKYTCYQTAHFLPKVLDPSIYSDPFLAHFLGNFSGSSNIFMDSMIQNTRDYLHNGI